MTKNTCAWCSVEFETKNPNKFCSIRCKSANNTERSKVEKNCAYCGKLYKGAPRSQCCSTACATPFATSKIVKQLTCVDCSIVFEFKGRTSAKRCETCRAAFASKRSYDWNVASGKIKNPGVGSGGAQWLTDNHGWKNGIGAYKRIGKAGKQACELCGTAVDSRRYYWCVHHIDEDRTNNDPSNLQFICKKCHQNTAHADLRYRDDLGRYEKVQQAELKSRNEAGTPSDG